VTDRPKLAAVARLIDEAPARAADLTHQLLAFARKQSLQPQKTDINALVTEAAKLLRANDARRDALRAHWGIVPPFIMQASNADSRALSPTPP